jgi:hypothetical protein
MQFAPRTAAGASGRAERPGRPDAERNSDYR